MTRELDPDLRLSLRLSLGRGWRLAVVAALGLTVVTRAGAARFTVR